MHPVMSELEVYIAEHEGWIRRDEARKHWLVREATAHGKEPALAARFVRAIHRFIDPRGYALAQVPPHAAATAPRPKTPIAVTVPEVREPVVASCAERVAA